MRMYFNIELKRFLVLLLVVALAVFGVSLLGQSLVFAGPPTPPTITAVSPNSATQGNSGVVVRIDISDIPPPSPNSVMIGNESGSNLQKDGSAVTATFDFPSGLTPAFYDVVVEFPGPGDPATVTAVLQNGFEVLQANCFTTYGANTTTQFASNNATAVQDAVDAAAATDVVKIAGSCTGTSTQSNLTQTVYLDKDLTLQGGYSQTDWTASPDANIYPTLLDADDTGRVVYISGTHAITIAHLTLQNGYVAGTNNGGALFNDSSVVTIENTILQSSRASDGGGIYNDGGTITLKDSMVNDNRADANTLSEDRGGGAIFNDSNAYLIVTNSQIVTNTTEGSGGGLFNAGYLTMTQSIVANNIGSAAPTRGGERIAAPQNFSDVGGGIANLYGDAWIMNSTIRNNSIVGTGGGGIAHTGGGHELFVESSTIEGNSASGGRGGGILYSEEITITNSTVSGNSADVGGGVHQYYDSTTAVIQYSTIASNTGSLNGNNLSMSDANGVVQLASSIIVGSGDNCYFPQGQLVDNGYNLESGANCGLTDTTSITTTNPLLYPLTDNGGDTETHAIDITSPAINKIGLGALGCGVTVVTDQRGEVRPDDKQCDIGAYELTYACETTYGAHASTQFSSTDAAAVQNAIDAATAGDVVKIAGYCEGVQNQNGTNQTVYIDKNITLQGGYLAGNWMATPNPVVYPTTLDADQNGRVAFITGTNTVELHGLIMTNGLANADNQDGGGIYNTNTTLTISNSQLISNTAWDSGGALFNMDGAVEIYNSSVSWNKAEDISPVSNNGGAIYNYTNGSLTINDSVVNYNFADGGVGGGVANLGEAHIYNSELAHNEISDQGTSIGGAAYNNNLGIMVISDSLIDDNDAQFGGGITSYGALTVTGATVRNNFADGKGGGGIGIGDGGTLYLADSIVNNNTVLNGNGGGVEIQGNMVTIMNSTISHNSAPNGGGINSSFSGDVTTIAYTTIASNTADINGNGIRFSDGTMTLQSSIIANNGSSNCSISGGSYSDGGYNLDSGTSCMLTGTGSLSNIDPQLQPLTNNGGDTATHALPDDSPALNQIGNGVNGCGTTITTDQRGETRPFATLCDIGAYELQDGSYTIYLPIILKQD